MPAHRSQEKLKKNITLTGAEWSHMGSHNTHRDAVAQGKAAPADKTLVNENRSYQAFLDYMYSIER